jgi:replicative DNA helicase
LQPLLDAAGRQVGNELTANMTFEVALKHLNAFANLVSENYDLRQLVTKLEQIVDEYKEVIDLASKEEDASSLHDEG